jgi:prophage pi3 protein
MNLLQETLKILEQHGYTFDDVIAIYGDKFQITKENFTSLADVEYCGYYAGTDVPLDLRILGNDFIMHRVEYDGCEWWHFEYTSLDKIPQQIKTIKALVKSQSQIKNSYNELDDLN